jgi:preprotein translocase subunit SecD
VVLAPAGMLKASKVDLAVAVLRSRIDRFGFANVSISRRGTGLVVHLPGVTDPTVAQRLVVPAELRFRPVLIAGLPPQPTSVAHDATADAAITSCDPDAVAMFPSIPTTPWSDDKSTACVVLPEVGNNPSRDYLGRAGVTGTAVSVAKAEFVAGQGWTVNIELTDQGSSEWDALAQQQFHQQVAIVVDGYVQSTPLIQPEESTFASFGGTAVISGRFSKARSTDLAKLINFGALPSLFRIKNATVNSPR